MDFLKGQSFGSIEIRIVGATSKSVHMSAVLEIHEEISGNVDAHNPVT